ncbi:hypothetical protein HOLleu_36214 [Holothuria leucospilota]|uniref:Ig-like domain-containing protein n=1 Tax=Holothuria leucospilota TaxID=206669 RepID=A0A9Q1BFJ1_HOLLE|nr:hypothetical protein HOLleu_36214 [Holothuria leucospilota]
MYLKVNGIEISSITYVKESSEVNITCHVIGARPAPRITWKEYQPNNTQMQQDKTLNATFDVTSTLIYTGNASKDEEVFICRSRIDEVNITDEISLKLVSYVLPEPILAVDDNSSDVIYIEQEERVTITCDASGAKPRAELSWMINGYPVNETIFKISRPSNIFSTLILQPRQNDTVKCTIFLPGPNETKMDSITFYVKVRNEEQSGDGRFDNLIIWVVLSLVATFMTVLVCCVGSATRRVKVLLISPEIDNEEIYCDVEDKAEEVANVEMIVQLPGEGMFQYWTANATFNKDVRTKIIAKCVSDSVQMKDHMKFKTLAESVATLNKHRNIIDILGVSTANGNIQS